MSAQPVDELLLQGRSRDWAIQGVGVLPGDARMRDALHEHDGLYTMRPDEEPLLNYYANSIAHLVDAA